MKYLRTTLEIATTDIAHHIDTALEKGSVLLLLSGGSNIQVAVRVRALLNLTGNQLTVSLIDERYGSVGHADSNWTKLIDGGFDTSDIAVLPVLTGAPFGETVANFGTNLEAALQTHDTIVGIFGMGADGHTSGVLPGSPVVDSPQIVDGYQGPDFERITTTPASFGLFDTAFLVAYGKDKQSPLEALQSSDLSIAEQPAQALKNCKELIIYSDPTEEGAL